MGVRVCRCVRLRAYRSSAAKDKNSGPRTTMRFLPGSVMGTDSEEMRKNGSMLDFFQNKRQGGPDDIRGVLIPDAVPVNKGDVSPINSDSDATDQLNKLFEGETGRRTEGKGRPWGKSEDDGALDKIWDDYE